ncbi:MAG: hypothetical protein IKY94_15775 [Lachnospiraceae bacterium]|nr:hypothetical protein [Lachnospiraceae bacterium]
MADSYILRPVSDVSLTHTCSTGSSGYALIDDETHDSDSTYISYKYATGSTSKSSTFLFTSKDRILINATLPDGLMYGDIDKDGVLTQIDVDTIKDHIMSGDVITNATSLKLADIDGNGSIQAKERQFLQKLVNLTDTSSSGLTYLGDSKGNWSYNASRTDGDGGIFYYDVTTSDSTTSCMAILSPSFAVNKNEFYCQCFNGYVRVFARNLPYYPINVTIEIFQSSEAISATLPAGLMYGDVDMNGILTDRDADYISEYLADNSVITDETKLALADVNGDGVINGKDITRIRALVGGSSVDVTTYLGDYLGNWSLSTDWGADFSRRFYRDITTSASTTSTMAFVIPNGNVRSYSGFQCECFNGYIRVYAKNLPLNEISINIRVINLDKTISSTLPAGKMRGDVNGNGILDEEDYNLLAQQSAGSSVIDEDYLVLGDVNNDGSLNIKDAMIVSQLTDLVYDTSSSGNYQGDYLNKWTFNNTVPEGDPKLFYYDIKNTQITTDYHVYIYTNSDASTNDYIAECFSGYVRIYARNIPKAQTTIKIGLKQKKSYPLDTVSGVKIHVVARRTGTLSNAKCNCYFAVGSDAGGSSADMGVEVSSLTTTYTDYTASSDAMAEAINNYIATNNAFPTISAKLTNSSSYSSYQIRVTQIYVELLYGEINTNLRIKQNNSWTPVTKVFKKVNGSWVEQTDLSSLFNTSTKYIKG